MAKKSVIAGEYIIEIADNGHVDVMRVFRNAMATLKGIADAKGFHYEDSWNTQHLGRSIIKEFGDGTTAVFDDITVSRDSSGKIEIYQVCKNVISTLREISSLLGYDYDEKWNTQHLGRNLVDYLEQNKELADKVLRTPNKKKEKASKPDWKTGYDYVEDAGNGVFYIKKNEKWGFANKDGVVVEPKFDWLGDEFVEGMIVTGQNDLCGFFSALGGEVVPPMYETATDFKNGIANVRIPDSNGERITIGEDSLPIGETIPIGKLGNRLEKPDLSKMSVDAIISCCAVKIFGADLLNKYRDELPDNLDLYAWPDCSLIELLNLMKDNIEEQRKLYILIAKLYMITEECCDNAICFMFIMEWHLRWYYIQDEDGDCYGEGYAIRLLWGAKLDDMNFARFNSPVTWNHVNELLGESDYEEFWNGIKNDDLVLWDESVDFSDIDEDEYETVAEGESSLRRLGDWYMRKKDEMLDKDGLYYTSHYELLYSIVIDGDVVLSYE